jgi:hypothetical protein
MSKLCLNCGSEVGIVQGGFLLGYTECKACGFAWYVLDGDILLREPDTWKWLIVARGCLWVSDSEGIR